MKQQLLFVQGAGAGVHAEWDNKLVESLLRELGEGYDVRYPRMPSEADPTYAAWKAALGVELRALPDGAILVGHSVGGTTLIRMLSERAHVPKLRAILLIAPPFLGDGGWSVDNVKFTESLGEQLPQDVPIHLFHGSADRVVPDSHVDLYARAVPRARVHRVQGADHQLNNDLSDVARAIVRLA